MTRASWGDIADRYLAEIFVRGEPAPSKEQIRDAYPFGERRYWPYKRWLTRVKAWQLAHSLGLSSPCGRDMRRPKRQRDTETLDAFAEREVSR